MAVRNTFPTALSMLLGLFAAGCGYGPPAGIVRGEVLYAACEPCHGANGSGNQAVGAPAIAGLPAWYVTRQLEHFRDGVRGTAFDDMGGMKMRPMARHLQGKDDVPSVAEYVSKMTPNTPATTVQGDASKGAASFALCSTCHGADASGNEAMNAPPLNRASDWYLVTQLEHFKSGARGSNPNDAFGATMKGMAATLPDEDAIHNVVAHIQTLRK